MNKWQSFVTLRWYDGLIEFLFRFVAKTSEPLLALGLVFSAADVLTKGRLMQSNLALTDAWAWTQAIAIESSGGVVLVYALQSFSQKDTLKGWLYVALSGLLAIVGGMMLYSQLLSNATGAADAFAVGTSWPVQALIIMRVVVSVGYVVMCRTKHIRFNDLQESTPVQAIVPVVTPSFDELIDRLDARYQQRMEALYQRTVETVKFTIAEATNPNMLAIKAPESGLANHKQIDEGSNGDQPIFPSRFASKEQEVARVLQANPQATIEEVAEAAGCSVRTAERWIQKLQGA